MERDERQGSEEPGADNRVEQIVMRTIRDGEGTLEARKIG